MNILKEFTDSELINEIKERGIELKIRVVGVEVEVSLGGIPVGDTTCKEVRQ